MKPNYLCEKCDYKCCDSSNWTKHLNTNKHLGKVKISKELLTCELCDYTCNKQSIMNKHQNTEKHKMKEALVNKTEPSSDSDIMTVVKQLLSQNNELKNFIIEQASEHKKETTEIVNKVIEQTNKVLDTVKPSNTIMANTINNNNNQKFNINVYLNEQCKDAINFSDFIKNLEVSREDLENNAQLGFVGGVSKILIDSLKQLDKTERPIHCTDVKRETMYIKDEDKWNKQDDSTKLNKAIQEVTRKSMGTLMNWKEENPDYKDRDSEFSERCIVIQQQSMAAHNRDTYYPKVVKAIAKEVTIST
jgi:hypothetical protein